MTLRKVVNQERGVSLPQKTHKHCSRCRGYLPFEDFRPNLKLKSGLSSWCAKCSNEYNQKWRGENREAIDAYNLARRVEPSKLTCTECSSEFEGRASRLVCSRRCKDRRYARLYPAKAGEKARRHQRRVRARWKLTGQ